MGGLAPLNLLVVIGAQLPQEVLGKIGPREEDIKQKFRQAREDDGRPKLREDGSLPVPPRAKTEKQQQPPSVPAARLPQPPRPPRAVGRVVSRECPASTGGAGAGVVASLCVLSGSLGEAAAGLPPLSPLVDFREGNNGGHACPYGSSGTAGCRSAADAEPLHTEVTHPFLPEGFGGRSYPSGYAGTDFVDFHRGRVDNRPEKPYWANDSGGGLGRGHVPGATSMPSQPTHASSSSSSGRHRRESAEPRQDMCQRACPGMVMVPQELVFGAHRNDEELETSSLGRGTRGRGEARKFVFVMSRENIAALLVIGSLSILGAIYLWNICTRRRCVCRVCRNQYRTLHLLGSGGYGSVYLVERLGDGTRFVSKKILVRNITEIDEYNREAKELVTLRHRHIVSYEEDFVHVEYGALEPKTYFMIIMEYCPEGDLKQKIELDFGTFTEEWVRTVFAQLLQAVQYLHSKNVIHRDLKSQNVFLAHDGRIRLGDFGLCRRSPSPALDTATLTHAGTDCYMAPEMLSSSRYGKPADIWSLGCVLYELCTGQFMWELDGILGAMVMKDSHAAQKLVQENVVTCVGSALISLMKRLLSVNPAARPTATTCMRKKIFKRGFSLSRVPFAEYLDPEEGEVEGSDNSPTRSQQATSPSTATTLAGLVEASDSNTSSDEDGTGGESQEDESDTCDGGNRPTRSLSDPAIRRRRQRRRRAGRGGKR